MRRSLYVPLGISLRLIVQLIRRGMLLVTTSVIEAKPLFLQGSRPPLVEKQGKIEREILAELRTTDSRPPVDVRTKVPIVEKETSQERLRRSMVPDEAEQIVWFIAEFFSRYLAYSHSEGCASIRHRIY